MIQNPMANIRIFSLDSVGVLEIPVAEVANFNKLRTLTEVVARINNLKDPIELKGETNNLIRTPMELAGKINGDETPTELIAGISKIKPLLVALADLWTSVSKSALPIPPESSVLVSRDVQKDALEINELSIPALN